MTKCYFCVIIVSENKTNIIKQEEMKMYEVVKVVNGHEITRAKGTHGYYYVYFGTKGNKFATFRTIKAAADFCETI